MRAKVIQFSPPKSASVAGAVSGPEMRGHHAVIRVAAQSAHAMKLDRLAALASDGEHDPSESLLLFSPHHSHSAHWPVGSASRLVVILAPEHRSAARGALRGGAFGVLLWSDGEHALVAALRAGVSGVRPLSPSVVDCLAQDASEPVVSDNPLSSRQAELLQLIAEGHTTASAAQAMSISPYTAAEYVKAIYRKLDVHSRGEAVSAAIRRRLIGRPQG